MTGKLDGNYISSSLPAASSQSRVRSADSSASEKRRGVSLGGQLPPIHPPIQHSSISAISSSDYSDCSEDDDDDDVYTDIALMHDVLLGPNTVKDLSQEIRCAPILGLSLSQ